MLATRRKDTVDGAHIYLYCGHDVGDYINIIDKPISLINTRVKSVRLLVFEFTVCGQRFI